MMCERLGVVSARSFAGPGLTALGPRKALARLPNGGRSIAR